MGTIKANPKGGVLNLTKGNDNFVLGKGVDILRVGRAAGKNVVNGYDSKKDIFEFAEGIDPEMEKDVVGYSLVGNDLIVRLGERKVTLKNMATKDIRARMQGNSKIKTYKLFKCLAEENGNAVNYAKNGNQYDWTKAVATADFSGEFYMRYYNENLKTFDARNVRRSIEIVGTYRNDVIYAGNYGGLIWAGDGNDTIYLGKGTDVIRVGTKSGNDTIYGYESGKDILEIAKGDYRESSDSSRGYSLVGNDLILRLDKANITLKGMATKTIKSRMQGQGKSSEKFDNFFKQISEENGNKIHYAKKGSSYDWTKVVADSNFSGYFAMDEYNENLKVFDGSKVKNFIKVKGGDNNDIIYAGNYGSEIWGDDGNDTIYCGNGADLIFYNNDDGNDTIVNFNAKKDHVVIGEDCGNPKSYAVDGKDLVVTIGQNKWHADHGNGTLRFKGGAAMNGIRLVGERSAQSRTITQSVSYNNRNKTLTALTTNVGGTYNLGAFAANGITLNAGKLKTKATLIGNAQNNKITAGQAGGDIKAGKGNDTITCGNGADRIWFAKGEGKDTVLKSGKNDVAYLYGVKDINQVTKKFAKGVMTLGIKGASDTLNISGWQAGKSLSTVELANHKKYTFGVNGSFKLTK